MLILVGGIVGTTLGWIEARMQKGIADSPAEEGRGTADRNQKINGLVTRGANVQRGDSIQGGLAMDAIKTFHTGVARDVLLKNDNLKPVRDRLLNNAADFYKRLEGFLANQADRKSRRGARRGVSGDGASLEKSVQPTSRSPVYDGRVTVIREMASSASGQRFRLPRRCDIWNRTYPDQSGQSPQRNRPDG